MCVYAPSMVLISSSSLHRQMGPMCECDEDGDTVANMDTRQKNKAVNFAENSSQEQPHRTQSSDGKVPTDFSDSLYLMFLTLEGGGGTG